MMQRRFGALRRRDLCLAEIERIISLPPQDEGCGTRGQVTGSLDHSVDFAPLMEIGGKKANEAVHLTLTLEDAPKSSAMSGKGFSQLELRRDRPVK